MASRIPPEVRMTPDRLLTLKEVGRLVGLKTTAIYDHMLRGQCPARVVINPRNVRWSEREVQEWIAARLAQREERRTA